MQQDPSPGGLIPSQTEQPQRQGERTPQPAKLLRLGMMIRELLEEARRASLDERGRERFREIHERSVAEVRDILSPELQRELEEVTLPFGEDTPSESELRISQAQLVGWLEGLFHGIQATLWAQHLAAQQHASQFPRRMPPGEKREEGGPYL